MSEAIARKEMSERRRFVMHENLLYSVILKQAGTLEKAALEGVMNSIDAGAKTIEITTSTHSLTISDDGHGFRSRTEIEEFFEKFGTPHEEGDARYGRFRMGRGQLFAFGVNRWETNSFAMDVDIKARGLDYDLHTIPAKTGCRVSVKLYDALTPSRKDGLDREIENWVRWTGVKTILNGRKVSKNPEDEKWDLVTEDAYFRFKATGGLEVYNLGVLVCQMSNHRHGTGGIIVSRNQLDVNFARNDIDSRCKVWKKIEKVLDDRAGKIVARKPALNDGERQHLAERIRSGGTSILAGADFKVLTDVEGKHHKLEKIWNLSAKGIPVSVAARGDRAAIKVHSCGRGPVFVFAQETLDRFSVDKLADLRDILLDRARKVTESEKGWGHRFVINENLVSLEIVAIDEVTAGISTDNEILPEKELSYFQKKAAKILQDGLSRLGLGSRMVCVGRSETADAWTDGQTFVAVNEKKLPLIREGYAGCASLSALLLHEMLHEGPDTDTHEHNHEFYERFHDMCIDSDVIGRSAHQMMKTAMYIVRQLGGKPDSKTAFYEDANFAMKRPDQAA